MKPGIHTTEFYLALLVVVLGALATLFEDNPYAQMAGALAAALASAGYGISRAKSKAAPSVNVTNK